MEVEECYKEVIQRLELFCRKNGGLSAAGLAERIGMPKRTVQGHFNKGTVSSEFLIKVLLSYPNLSADWLMRGIGGMERSPKHYENAEVGMLLTTTLQMFDKFMEKNGQSDIRQSQGVQG